MTGRTFRRSGAMVVSAVLLASLAVATTATPAAAKPTCVGRPATIVGTAKDDTIKGTQGRDVIFAGAGNDRIQGLGGPDLICGGPGDDRVVGGKGHDWLHGGSGRDWLDGGPGNDKLVGGPGGDELLGSTGNDRLIAGAGSDLLVGAFGRDVLIGGPGDDTLVGGPSDDRLSGGEGKDRLFGNAGRDVCRPGPGRGPHQSCEVMPPIAPRNLAIAFSDLDGNHRYGPGDVLINRLFDTNGDGVPSPGDTIHTGRAPVDFAMSAFTDWGVDSLVVTRVQDLGPYQVAVETSERVHEDLFVWADDRDSYTEYGPGVRTVIQDGYRPGPRTAIPDTLLLDPRSPSQPATAVDLVHEGDLGVDQRFIEVINYP